MRNMGAHTVVLELLQIPYEKVRIIINMSIGHGLSVRFSSCCWFHCLASFRMMRRWTGSWSWLIRFCKTSAETTQTIKFCYTNTWTSSSLLGFVDITRTNLRFCFTLYKLFKMYFVVKATLSVFRQLLEAETMRHIFMNNNQLCNEISDRVVHHFVHCIETHGRHIQYLRFLQTIVKCEGKYMKKCQDKVMTEVGVRLTHANKMI